MIHSPRSRRRHVVERVALLCVIAAGVLAGLTLAAVCVFVFLYL